MQRSCWILTEQEGGSCSTRRLINLRFFIKEIHYIHNYLGECITALHTKYVCKGWIKIYSALALRPLRQIVLRYAFISASITFVVNLRRSVLCYTSFRAKNFTTFCFIRFQSYVLSNDVSRPTLMPFPTYNMHKRQIATRLIYIIDL